MKTTAEILQLILDQIQERGKLECSGLCWEAEMLYDNKVITPYEFYLIEDFFENEAKKSEYGNDSYLFEPEVYEPRVAWLKEQIEILTKQ